MKAVRRVCVCVWFIIDLEDHCQPKPKKKKKKLLEGAKKRATFSALSI
jgi:hypothetical protein